MGLSGGQGRESRKSNIEKECCRSDHPADGDSDFCGEIDIGAVLCWFDFGALSLAY